MRWGNIAGIMWRDYRIFLGAQWRWVEFFYFPITSLVIWGLFSLWTAGFAAPAGAVALVVNIFWSHAYVVQATINLSINEDTWSGTGSQLLACGLGKFEYVFGRMLLSLIISSLNLGLMLGIAQLLFFDVLGALPQMLALAGIATLVSVGLAMLIGGLIFALGREYTWLAWSALQFFVLLSFPLIPLQMLPHWLQALASSMPFASLFQGVRALAMRAPWQSFAAPALLMGLLYLGLGILVYNFGFENARRTGKLAKMF